MIKILIHTSVFDDIKLCSKRCWYTTLGKEMPGVCRLLMQDAKMPGERPVHYIKEKTLYNKIFHAGINLPEENVGKKKGGRIIYAKEESDLIKIIYSGGHKDKRYDNSFSQVNLIKERYFSEGYVGYFESLNFDNPIAGR
jgi:hypothetical protein